MEFSKWVNVYGAIRRNLGREPEEDDLMAVYNRGSNRFGHSRGKEIIERLLCERRWESIQKPYYRIYPSIEPLLASATLDVPGDNLVFPVSDLVLEFSEKSRLKNYSVLISSGKQIADETKGLLRFHVLDAKNDEHWFFQFRFDNTSVEKNLSEIGLDDLEIGIVKIFVGACMLADDPELIEPIVLNRDAIKHKIASLEQRKIMEDRAARLNGRGWAIGKGFEERCEVSPHFRKSHLALFWTGKGREVPKLQLRKGCLVKRKKAIEMPTGYYGKDTPDDDPSSTET